MNNKTSKYILVCFLTFLALGVTGFMIGLLSGKLDFFHFDIQSESTKIKEETFEYTNLDTIKINSTSSDISIKKATDNQIKVEIYGKENSNPKIEMQNNNLSIATNNMNSICFGFCFRESKIILYVPENIESKLEMNTTSGNILVENFNLLDIKANTTSGDIKLGASKNTVVSSTSGDIDIESTNNTNLKTTSGDITVNIINGELDIESTSGKVKIDVLTINTNSKIKTISGDVRINSLTNGYVDANTISGDVSIKDNNRFADYTLTIKTTSGDIHIK